MSDEIQKNFAKVSRRAPVVVLVANHVSFCIGKKENGLLAVAHPKIWIVPEKGFKLVKQLLSFQAGALMARGAGRPMGNPDTVVYHRHSNNLPPLTTEP